MKFDSSKDQEASARDAKRYEEFLAGDKTGYAKAFWDNGPRGRNRGVEQDSSGLKATGADNKGP
ncbi:hypothetical protein VDG1235_954 [Verrucomicrobiia bacterium DG1235]|nr:hypothetical protein VDG1235_954 [Verrucomicrobiae bacterium DG1235]